MSPKLPERIFSRRLTPDEVIRLSHGQRIPHLRDDEVVRAIRRCALGVIGEGMFKEARERGYLIITPAANLRDTNRTVADLWGWWCMAAKVPEAVIDLRPRVNGGIGPRVRVDLSPTGRSFSPAALAPIGRVCAAEGAGSPDGWIATPDVIEVDAPDMDGASSIVRVILALAREERWLVRG